MIPSPTDVSVKTNFITPKKKLGLNFSVWFTHRFLGETRTRILAWYTVLTAIFVGLSIPIFTKLVIRQVDQRVREDLREEIIAFQQSAKKQIQGQKGTNPKQIFDTFLYTTFPADKTFLVATIDGHFYRSSPLSLPPSISSNSLLLQQLAQTTQSIRGQNIIQDEQVGEMLYKTEPLTVNGEILGVLIIAYIVRGEREEVLETVYVVIQVLLVCFIGILILGWLISGHVLHPIQSLIKTACSISETDLSRRIPESGRGEMADLAKTFNQMMDRLEQAFITQRQLVNDVSHELRTPISIIQGYLESLDYYDPEERPEIIHLVLDELQRMTRLVEDLLLLARADHKDFLILETIDLTTFTEELYLKVQGFEQRNWQLERVGIGRITVDPQRITQAIMNLVQNAVQHSEENDMIIIGSSLESQPNQQELRLWVRDTGVGISPEDQHRIFQRFERAENSRSSSQGAGLGLSIVTAIAESHGGCVELHSQLGQGAMFTLVLPMKKRLKP